jgi:hypothetical protein
MSSEQQRHVRLTLPGAPDTVDIPGLHIGPLRPGVPTPVPEDREDEVQNAIDNGAPIEWAQGAGEPFKGYHDATVEDITDRLDDLTAEDLAAIYAFERAGKQRRGVLDAVAKAIHANTTQED